MAASAFSRDLVGLKIIMARGTVPPPPQQSPTPPGGESDQYGTLIDVRVRHTQRQVKGVDIAAGLLTLAVGALVYLLLAALIDHWVVSGGLGFAGRLSLFLVLAIASAVYFWRRILPLLIHRINPLFAAHTIEQSRPSLKNSLINLLLLRSHRAEIERDRLSGRIYQALERSAATDLSRIAPDAVVDHSQVIRNGYRLAGVVLIGAVYMMLSPKDPLTSFGRVVFPWAGLPAPTRVTIDRVEPGDQVVYQGDHVTIAAEVHGLKPDEAVHVHYTTADGQSVNQAVPMTLSEGEYRHRCRFPPGTPGMQQETVYRIAAGDCTTRPFRLQVQPALTIQIDSLDYHYPEYTGLEDRTVARQGDVRAVEGTRITVRATASHPVQHATIDMDCDPRFGVNMTPSGTGAVGQFTLAMSREEPGRAQHESYQLRFRDAEGRENRRPTRYRIEVIADLPPDVRWIDPPPDRLDLPVDGALDLRLRAEDPDYALRHVAVRMEVEGRSLLIPPLLNKVRPEKAHPGPFEASYRFQPAKFGLKPGDRVVYLAEARDNKEPVANQSQTQPRTLRIAPPQHQKSPQQERSEDGRQGAGQEGGGGRKDDPSKQPAQQEMDKGQEKSQGQEKQQGKSGEQGRQQTGQAQDGAEPSEKPKPKAQQGNQQANEDGQGDASPQGGQGESRAGDSQGSKPSGDPRQPIDGRSNPGDVFEKVLERREEQEQEQKGEQQAAGSKQQETGGQQQGGGGKQESSREAAEPAPRGSEQAAGGKQHGKNEEKPGQNQPGAAKHGSQEKPGEQSSAGQPQRNPDNRQDAPKTPAPGEKPEPGQGMQSQGAGQPDQAKEESSGPKSGQRPDGHGGDREKTAGSPGGGRPAQESKGSPSPQEANRERPKSAAAANQKPSEQKDPAQSPSMSPKTSDSQGDTGGDRSGGGEQGGGQAAKQPGAGTAGTHSAAEQGGDRSDEPGKGETGTKAGDQAKADRPTGRPASEGQGPGTMAKDQSGAKQAEGGKQQAEGGKQQGTEGKPDASREAAELAPRDSQSTQPNQPGQSAQPGAGKPAGQDPAKPGSPGAGIPAGGGLPGPQPDATAPPPTVPPQGDPHNREFAEKQTTLALEYLKDQLAKEKPDQTLLDRLGWSRKDVERFVDWWEGMRKTAAQPGPEGEATKKRFDEALKSLGLRPRGTELRGGDTRRDRMQNLREPGRFEPPPEYGELLRAYNRGVAGSKE